MLYHYAFEQFGNNMCKITSYDLNFNICLGITLVAIF
jgi:hypothetical protein